MIGSFIAEAKAGILTLFYPPHCGSCGSRLPDKPENDSLCAACLSLILPPPEHVCPVCSHPLEGSFQCPNCEGRRWHLEMIVPGCRYGGLVRELLQRFKYGRDQSLMRPLGDLMFHALSDPRLKGKEFDVIVPVPLHPLREREREFNQAALLAQRLASHLRVPVMPLVKRTRSTTAQAGFDRSHRLKNLEGAFEMRGSIVEGASVLLVDDVMTTGTTLNACASVLSAAGAGEICAVTVARG